MDPHTGGLLHMAGPEFAHLESLTLAATADIAPTRCTLPFSSCWVSHKASHSMSSHLLCTHSVLQTAAGKQVQQGSNFSIPYC